MLTYDFDSRKDMSLYEFLYEKIKEDIISGNLVSGEKLPSKREMAVNNGISVITVENAYEQLVVEGFINSIPKKGFYVTDIGFNSEETYTHKTNRKDINSIYDKGEQEDTRSVIDFTADNVILDGFPFSIWTKLMRRTLLDTETNFLKQPESIGIAPLRIAIARHLLSYRGLSVNPDNIIVGAGTEYLYSLVVSLLGREGIIAVEDPGYSKAAKVFNSCGIQCKYIAMDNEGMDDKSLKKSNAILAHVTPSHHFPLGTVMSASRRIKIIKWAVDNDAYILEDDYDSEFRFKGRPVPAMASLNSDRVIYMNTFSKTLAPSIRIAYMVLPENLMDKYRETLGFYSGTVTGFEQYTLANFINEGYLERHINRMRNTYRKYRDNMLKILEADEYRDMCTVTEGDIGLHFILKINTILNDEDVKNKLLKKGYIIRTVSDYCHNKNKKYEHLILINYSDISEEKIRGFLTEIANFDN